MVCNKIQIAKQRIADCQRALVIRILSITAQSGHDSTDYIIHHTIVTADHSHVFSIAGYPKRGNDILGKVIPVNSVTSALMEDSLPYTTLGYMNGHRMHNLGEETMEGSTLNRILKVLPSL